ncbi:MAG: hypothetical protein ABI672_02595 [Vicinamibacteria bacterium]
MTRLLVGMALALASVSPAHAQGASSAGPWMRLDPLPAEMKLTARESFDGVPPRFLLMTDGSVYVGGRRELLRGMLDKTEMQEFSTRLDLALKSVAKTGGVPKTLTMGDGPAIFRFSVLAGSQFQTVVVGSIPTPGAPALAPLPEFIRRLSAFRHVSLRPYDPKEFAMTVKERTLPGGCRAVRGWPSLAASTSGEVVMPENLVRGFPFGADLSQICESSRRYTVVLRPLAPGER